MKRISEEFILQYRMTATPEEFDYWFGPDAVVAAVRDSPILEMYGRGLLETNGLRYVSVSKVENNPNFYEDKFRYTVYLKAEDYIKYITVSIEEDEYNLLKTGNYELSFYEVVKFTGKYYAANLHRIENRDD